MEIFMKILIAEIDRCLQCAWISKDPIGYHHCRYNNLLEIIPDKFSISSFCPLPDVEGTNRKMLMREIDNCGDCAHCNMNNMGLEICTYYPDNVIYLDMWDGDVPIDSTHHRCPLPDVDPNPEGDCNG